MEIPLRDYARLFRRYLHAQWPRVGLLTVLLFADIALQLLIPQILSNFIDNVQAGVAASALLRAAALFLGLAVIQQVTTIWVTYVSENVGWTATNALRTDLVAHTLGLDMSFHKAHTPGEMIERVDGDVTALSNFFSQFIIQVLGNALLIVGVIVLLFREDWRVSLAITLFAAATLAILARFRNLAVPYFNTERETNARFFGFLEERLAGTEDIRANGAQTYVMRRFYSLIRDQLQASLKAGWMINIVLNLSFILFAIGTAAAFGVSAHLFRRGFITIGTVYLVYHYTRMLERPLQAIARQLQDLQRAGAGVARVQALLTSRSRLPQVAPTAAHKLPKGALGVHFRDVTFGYNDDLTPELVQPTASTEGLLTAVTGSDGSDPKTAPASASHETILHDLTFDVAPDTVLGLLGRTGSGKTTLTRLILRFYDPDTGIVALGNHRNDPVDIRKVPLRELRRHVGVVTQEIQLFNTTVRDNLTLFDSEIPDDTIVTVLTSLGLGPWLEGLPAGLDTCLGADQGGLSAGEAQLLAFARIFLHDPGLVLLDEASSRLDPATEQLIERAVDRLVEGRTAIIIAHRLDTVQRADEIMILQGGHIVEHGSRETLVHDPTSRFSHLLETGLEEVMA